MVISIITWNVTVFDHYPSNPAGNIHEQATALISIWLKCFWLFDDITSLQKSPAHLTSY